MPCLNRPKNEAKSTNLASWCRKSDFSFLCADYYGVGRSSGEFQDGSVGRWTSDTLKLIEQEQKSCKSSKVILVGHGVGTWVSFLVASKRPDLIDGIVGMSADPDFTEELLWKKLPEEVKTRIMNDGVYEITWGAEKYPISRKLIEDGRENLILEGGKNSLPVKCPVRLIHSISDEEVDYTFALKLVDNCISDNASVLLLKDSCHNMEDERDFKAMRTMVSEVIDSNVEGRFDLTSPGSG